MDVSLWMWPTKTQCSAETIGEKQWKRSGIQLLCGYFSWQMPECVLSSGRCVCVLFLTADVWELLSSCALSCLQTLSHQSVPNHFQNSLESVEALSMAENQVTHNLSHMVGCGLLASHPISLDTEFLCCSLVKDLHTLAHTKAISLTSLLAVVVSTHLSDLMRWVPESVNFYLYSFTLHMLLFVFSFNCWLNNLRPVDVHLSFSVTCPSSIIYSEGIAALHFAVYFYCTSSFTCLIEYINFNELYKFLRSLTFVPCYKLWWLYSGYIVKIILLYWKLLWLKKQVILWLIQKDTTPTFES